MIIDTHCHYNLEPLEENFQEYWKSAQNKGITSTIIVGTDIDNSKVAISQAETDKNLFSTVGLHPGNYTEFISNNLNGDQIDNELIIQKIKSDIKQLTALLDSELNKEESTLVSLGEIGLDYYRLRKKGLKRDLAIDMQRQMFRAQLELAAKHNLVVILHVRDQIDRSKTNAYYDTLDIINKVPGLNTLILHCVSGPQDYIDTAIKLGAYIGIAGNITYDNAPELREILKLVPTERLLLETDAPYLTPSEFRGEICKPEMITATAKFLQEEMSVNLDIINKNTLKVFPKLNTTKK